MEEETDNSITQKLEVVTRNMENTEITVARKPEAVMPKAEGNEQTLALKIEAAAPSNGSAEAPQERKPEIKPEAATPKADSNSMVERKEVDTAKAEGSATPSARKPEIKPEAATPKTDSNSMVERKEVDTAKVEGSATPAARKPEIKPEAATPKAEGDETIVVRRPEKVTPQAAVPNNVLARRPEAVMPKAGEARDLVVRKPEAATSKGEGIGYPVASKPETVMPKTEAANNRQTPERRPEPPMPRPAAIDYSQARQPVANMPRVERELAIPETPVPSLPGTPVRVLYKRLPAAYTRFIPRDDAAKVHLIEEQCRSFCLSLFFREHDSIRSLGITSSIPGEGKSFIASMMAHVLSSDSSRPVLLVECDWENANYHDYFDIPPVPGLAEWLRGECAEKDIRYQVNDNLTVIRAGDGHQDAVRLIQYILKRGLQNTLARNDESLLIDLSPVITSSYSVFAANMVDALALVVRAGVTPNNLVADACNHLSNLPVQGIILNQVEYRSRPYSTARKAR